ncbi:MAG: pfkA [Gammaproteobacteria bacterium]|jgi:6-phosphofructokinase 1|nr:pfkA [Gammaproteobacteria bacterium]
MKKNKLKKLLIITSGGDAPGMNAALRAVLRTALSEGLEVFACENGYQGLIDENFFSFSSRQVANCLQRGGTILKTGRYEAFKEKATRDRCRASLEKLGIDAMVVLGGDGSFKGASLLESEGGPRTIGIPCTIDNDIIGTEYTIGFDTASNTALEAIDRLRDTAFSLNNHFLVEVMGRAAGFLAVDVGIAGGAEFILIPEAPITTASLVHQLQHRKREKLASIIVVAEAGHPGRSMILAEEIMSLSGLAYKTCILGHAQRGGAPTVKDRKTAALMGYYAVKHLLAGHSQQMIALKDEKIIMVPFPDPALGARCFAEQELLAINRLICEI